MGHVLTRQPCAREREGWEQCRALLARVMDGAG